MLGHFQTLLEGIVANPEQRLSGLPLLTEAEHQQLLAEWNATQTAYPKDVCIHELFEAQVQQRPDALAVVWEGKQLSYKQLNQRANQLAHYLQRQGVGPEVRVGLRMERSLEMVVGLLGILKAGGAYVPLDPAYPQERLAFMLADAQVPVLLTQQSLVADLADQEVKVSCMDKGWEDLAKESKENLANTVTPDNLAYVIYTSGSTGRPKGAMILHRGLVNYLSWCTQAYEVGVGKGSPVHSPLGFDLTVTSLFSPLLVGQRVVLLPENQRAEALPEALRNGVNFSLVKLTPSHMQLLNQSLPSEEAA